MPKRIHATILTLLSLSIASCSEESNEPTSATLQLDNGGQLLFFAEEDGHVSVLETGPSPADMGLINAMSAESATPAELWLSVAGQDELPTFLLDNHYSTTSQGPVAFVVDVNLHDGFRSMNHASPAWGGGAGYCSGSFSSDFEAYNPETTTVSLSGSTSSPLYGYSDVAVKQAWLAVCNNHPIDDNSSTGTKYRISRRATVNDLWTPLQCETPPGGSAGWCNYIGDQYAKAVHYWTTNANGYLLRYEATWAGGVHHDSFLLAGHTTTAY